jgi:Predicted nucleic acid-binding protein, contains PIN domain
VTDVWLIDKSAFVRLEETPDSDLWLERLDRGLVRVTTVTLLEIGFSARSGTSWNSGFANPPLANMPIENATPRIEARAIEVQGLLARRGHHRAVKVPDLVISATAELAGLTVLHIDKDFDLIAKITGQRVERLRGDF